MKNKKITINATLTHDKLVFKSAEEGVYYKEYKRESLLDNSTFDDDVVLLTALLKLERGKIETSSLYSLPNIDIKSAWTGETKEIEIVVRFGKSDIITFDCITKGVYYKRKTYFCPPEALSDDFVNYLCEHEGKQIEALYPGINVTFLQITK